MSLEKINLFDEKINELNNQPIVGIDEVGYGCWAGPVYVCALKFNKYINSNLYSFCDSKSISSKKRESFYNEIKQVATWNIGKASVEEINENGLAAAYRKAIERAVAAFDTEQLVIDGRKPSYLDCIAVVKGDQKIKAISAASIVAKVERDRLMELLHQEFTVYNWKKNKGYGTKEHADAIRAHGFCKFHRSSYNFKSL